MEKPKCINIGCICSCCENWEEWIVERLENIQKAWYWKGADKVIGIEEIDNLIKEIKEIEGE